MPFEAPTPGHSQQRSGYGCLSGALEETGTEKGGYRRTGWTRHLFSRAYERPRAASGLDRWDRNLDRPREGPPRRWSSGRCKVATPGTISALPGASGLSCAPYRGRVNSQPRDGSASRVVVLPEPKSAPRKTPQGARGLRCTPSPSAPPPREHGKWPHGRRWLATGDLVQPGSIRSQASRRFRPTNLQGPQIEPSSLCA